MSRFVWFEYVSKEPKKAQGFFGELFGWGTQEVPFPGGSYSMIAAGDKTVGGYMTPPAGAPQQAHWLSHLGVTSAAETAKQVTALGGSVAKEPVKMSDFGTMAIVKDPQGGVFALWQPGKPGDEPPKVENGHFCWNELGATDPEAAVKFYKAIGGFELEAMNMGPEMGTYHVLKSGGQPRAGIMKKMMAEQPHAWLPYVQVASADATAEKAKKLGATVIVPPTDIPNVGRFAIFSDPQGAALGVLQPPRS